MMDVIDTEEVGSLLEDNQAGVQDLAKFGTSVKLKAFQPFSSAENALENMNAISEQQVTPDLENFLESNLPSVKKGKKAKFQLGVVEPGLASAIGEKTDVPCRCDDTVRELIRGIRLHFGK